MNATHQMNRLECRLLSMLRPDEMLRFVLHQTTTGDFSVSFEGSGPDPVGLMERISAILGASRSEGFLFNPDSGPVRHASEWTSDQGGCRVVELVPNGMILSRLPQAQLGFVRNMEESHATGDDMVQIPAFPNSGCHRLVDHPMALLQESAAIRVLEIEFIRKVLDASSVKLVGKALDDDIVLRRSTYGSEMPATPASAFLALWFGKQVGWQVNCRVFLDPEMPLPAGVLEVVGGEIFGAECRIVETEDSPKEKSSPMVSLAQSYPDGWLFPAFLPPITEHCMLAAERIHNLHLPALPRTGMLAGIADGKEVRMPAKTRDRHVYIAGATGTGKSTLLRRFIRADLRRKEGLVLLDPHGDLYHQILASIPKNRRGDVVTIDPMSDMSPIGFNVLDFPRDRFLKRRAEFLVGELIRFFHETWNKTDAFGPMFEIYFRNALRLMIHQKNKLLTLMDFDRVFVDREFRKELLSQCTDERVCRFWTELAEKVGGEASLANVAPYITSKVSVLTQSGFVSDLIGHPKDELRLEDRINRGGIILVNLNKGLLGANESRLLGVLLTMQIFAAGLKRSILPARERRPVNVYIDEFQNFVSDNVASMLSEARKFGLRMNLANQTLSQLNAGGGHQNLLETVLGNVGNMIVFRLGVPDAERLKPFLKPFTPEQMQDLPNFHALVRILDEKGPIGPLVMKTLPA